MSVLSLSKVHIMVDMVSGSMVEILPIKIYNALRYSCGPVTAWVAVVFVVIAKLADVVDRK